MPAEWSLWDGKHTWHGHREDPRQDGMGGFMHGDAAGISHELF